MSIRHVVCFRFHPDTDPARVAALAEALRALPPKIPEISAYLVGPDLDLNPTTWDFAVTADFASVADFETYRDHPDHQAAIATFVVPITAERIAVQFTA